MKKISLLSFAGLVLSLVAVVPQSFAEDMKPAAPAPEARGPGGARQIEMLAKRLNLTDDQKTKVGGILKDQMSKMMALRDDESLSQSDRRSKMMAMRKDAMTKIRALLTPEQQATFDKMPAMGGGGSYGKKKADGGAPAPAAPPTT
jgi:periplasmic protein CpxP/Spy